MPAHYLHYSINEWTRTDNGKSQAQMIVNADGTVQGFLLLALNAGIGQHKCL